MTVVDVDQVFVELDVEFEGEGEGRQLFDPMPWRRRAACRPWPLELWFPERGDHTSISVARSICTICPVRVDCLSRAVTLPEPVGMWGGRTSHKLRALHRHHLRHPYDPITALEELLL